MRLDQKVTFIRSRLYAFAQDMEFWSWMIGNKDPKWIEYQKPIQEVLKAFEERLLATIARMDDPKACPSSCKRMYFCELEKGHDGIHREGGLGWSEEQSDSAPLDCFDEKETNR